MLKLNKKVKSKLRGIAKVIVISFFFTSFSIFITSLFLKKEIDTAIALVNKIVIVEKNVKSKATTMDNTKKRLINYPRYGEIYGSIKIPKLDKDLPLYHGDSLSILKYGVGHYVGSYFPGEGGTILIAAHNSEKYFRHINELNESDIIVIETSYGKFTYEFIEGKVMNKKELEKLEIEDKEEVLVMYTCYPMTAIGLTNERYVVTAKLIGENYE